MTTNHPAHGPLSLDRLHQISEILSKAAAQSDGGNLGYAMADAVKVIDVAIAAFGAEPVAYMHRSGQVVTREECCDDKTFAICCKVETPLYTAPQLPQPAVLSVSEGVLKSLLPDVEKSEFWFEHNGKIFFEGVRFNNAVFEACRAAMQSFGNSEQLDEVGSWNNHMNTPTAQAGNSPVTQDTWIPVSERMPDNGGKSRELYLCWGAYFDGDKPDYIPAYFFIHPTNGWSEWEPVEDDCNPKSVIITHWMPLPSAPQQEVK